MLARNAQLSLEPNDTFGDADTIRADDAAGRSWVLGHTGPGDPDLYEIELAQDRPVLVQTRTPAGKSGEFQNLLDPALRLFDAAGNLVAEDDDGAADGVNARLRSDADLNTAGTYYLQISPSDEMGGERRGVCPGGRVLALGPTDVVDT